MILFFQCDNVEMNGQDIHSVEELCFNHNIRILKIHTRI